MLAKGGKLKRGPTSLTALVCQGDSLMLALFIPVFVSLLGGFAFLRSGKYVGKDRYVESEQLWVAAEA